MEDLKGNEGGETEWSRVLLKSIFWLETSNCKYMSYILQVIWNKIVAWLDYYWRLSVRCKWMDNWREQMLNQSQQQGTSLGTGEMSGSWDWGIGSKSGQMTLELDCISIPQSERLKLLVDWVQVINWGQAQWLGGTGCNKCPGHTCTPRSQHPPSSHVSLHVSCISLSPSCGERALVCVSMQENLELEVSTVPLCHHLRECDVCPIIMVSYF